MQKAIDPTYEWWWWMTTSNKNCCVRMLCVDLQNKTIKINCTYSFFCRACASVRAFAQYCYYWWILIGNDYIKILCVAFYTLIAFYELVSCMLQLLHQTVAEPQKVKQEVLLFTIAFSQIEIFFHLSQLSINST